MEICMVIEEMKKSRHGHDANFTRYIYSGSTDAAKAKRDESERRRPDGMKEMKMKGEILRTKFRHVEISSSILTRKLRLNDPLDRAGL